MSKLGGVAKHIGSPWEEERNYILADEDNDSFSEMSGEKLALDVSSDDDQEAAEVAKFEEPSMKHLGLQNACHCGGRWQHGATSSEWDWHSTEFKPTVFTFGDSQSGLSNECSVTEESEEIEFFLEFVGDDVVDVIVQETNCFCEFVMEKQHHIRSSKFDKWEATTRKEIYIFLCVNLLMAHAKKYSLIEYWTEDSVFEIPLFKKLMTQDQFIRILQLHFCDNRKQMSDRLQKIWPILDLVRKKFKTKFKPFQDLCIEDLVLWKDQLGRRCYMPKKHHRSGIKLTLLCDVDSGYILDFLVDTGKKSEIVLDQELGSAASI